MLDDLLNAYLTQERQRPFEWGKRNGDCLLFLAGWGLMLNGYDFAADMRGRYHDQAGALAMIRQKGGAVAYVSSVSGKAKDADSAIRGDVGLMAVGDALIGTICTGKRWVLRAEEGGLRSVMMPPQHIWAPSPLRFGPDA